MKFDVFFSKKINLKSKKNYFIFPLLIFLLLSLNSCHQKEKIVYFQENKTSEFKNYTYNPKFKADDLLSINIIAQDEATVKLFNMPYGNVNQNVGGYSTGNLSQPGYLISSDGFIDFPIIGKIKLSGLTRQEAIDTIKEKLKSFIQDPLIIIRMLNYKVTVLGEVKNPGTFTIPNERITLLEAIGIAGDLEITAKRNNILVLREVDGKLTETRIDLTKKDVFNSSVYYLQQNDVVYIEPNRVKMNSALYNTANVSTGISIISLLVTITLLFFKK